METYDVLKIGQQCMLSNMLTDCCHHHAWLLPANAFRLLPETLESHNYRTRLSRSCLDAIEEMESSCAHPLRIRKQMNCFRACALRAFCSQRPVTLSGLLQPTGH